jgi:hypothetical protein
MAQGGREQTVLRVLRPGKEQALLPYRSFSLYSIPVGRRKKALLGGSIFLGEIFARSPHTLFVDYTD